MIIFVISKHKFRILTLDWSIKDCSKSEIFKQNRSIPILFMFICWSPATHHAGQDYVNIFRVVWTLLCHLSAGARAMHPFRNFDDFQMLINARNLFFLLNFCGLFVIVNSSGISSVMCDTFWFRFFIGGNRDSLASMFTWICAPNFADDRKWRNYWMDAQRRRQWSCVRIHWHSRSTTSIVEWNDIFCIALSPPSHTIECE